MAEEPSYAVRRVPRGRRLKVRIDPERGVEVLLPAGVSRRAADAAVSELRAWIEEQLAERLRQARSACAAPAASPISTSELVLVLAARAHAHEPALRELLAPAGAGARAAIERCVPPRRARRDRRAGFDRACAASGARYTQPDDPQPAHALGELRERRRDELQLAAPAGPRAGARLRRLA